MWIRAAALGAVVLATAAAAGLVVAGDGVTHIAGYVSESGVAGAARPDLYRLSIFAIAGAVALLALAVREVSGHAAVLFLAAVPAVVASGSVPCSAGCPLPPYQKATAADLVHAGASIAGMVLCTAGMVAIALRATDRVVRLTTASGLALAVPLQAGTGLAMLIAGRGTVTGALERAAVAVSLVWLVGVALTRAVRRKP